MPHRSSLLSSTWRYPTSQTLQFSCVLAWKTQAEKRECTNRQLQLHPGLKPGTKARAYLL